MLPAILTCLPGRDRCGLLLFVRKCFTVSAVHRMRADFGEYLDVVLAGMFRLFIVYRNGRSGLARDLDDTMHVFNNGIGPLPSLWVGDFNWTMLGASSPTLPALARDCTL